MTALFRKLLWIAAGAAILLAPAALWGRPFVFYDTPAYWGWGRDIWEALLQPWPRPGQAWSPGRALHGWEIGAHGAGIGDLRFTLTLLTARSAFYAVPFYLLTRAGGLWLVAGLQALAAAWSVHTVARALVPGLSGLACLALLAALTLLSSLGFEAAYAMPDLFGGLALLAAAALIAGPDRFGPAERLGLVAVMTYAALAHAENSLNLAAAAGVCVLLRARWGRPALTAAALPIVAALVVAVALSAAGRWGLAEAFGRPPVMAPFAASRVLADGEAQPYLRQACRRTALAACDLAEARPAYAEYYLGIYPLQPPPRGAPGDPAHLYDQIQHRSVSDAEAAHRERFVAEQARLVLGAVRADAPGLARASLANGVATFLNFGVNPDFDSLAGLMQEGTQRREQIAAITPNAAACARDAARGCGGFALRPVAALQGLVVWACFALLAVGAVLRPRMEETGDRLRLFAGSAVGLVAVNAMLCGGVGGPYDRYQSRVEWLVPLCVLLAGLQWLRRRRAASLAAPQTGGRAALVPALAAAGESAGPPVAVRQAP